MEVRWKGRACRRAVTSSSGLRSAALGYVCAGVVELGNKKEDNNTVKRRFITNLDIGCWLGAYDSTFRFSHALGDGQTWTSAIDNGKLIVVNL